jgi:methionine synthase II (cobalamin-independent)
MSYDPRTATGIPTKPVGSIPRPLKLRQAYTAYNAKKMNKAQLEQEQDAAVSDIIKRFEGTGSPVMRSSMRPASPYQHG